MAKDIVRGASLPPPGEARSYDVFWPKLGTPLDVVILSERLYGVYLHWGRDNPQDSPRTHLCTAEEGCDRCGKQALHWAGFAEALRLSSGQKVGILQVSVEAARSLYLHAQAFDGLRGLRVLLERGGGRANGPVRVTLSSLAAPRQLPPRFDLGHTLRTLYGVRTLPGFEVAADDVEGIGS